MSWTQTIDIDAKLATSLIEEQCALKVESIAPFGEGWDNIAFLVNARFVFRFPRREMGVECMNNEILLLPYLAGGISFKASIPAFIGHASPKYPAPFSGYEKLDSYPLCERPPELVGNQLFARELASWLRELHQIKVNEAHFTQIAGDQTWRIDIEHRIDKSIERLKADRALFEREGVEVERYQAKLEMFRNLRFEGERCYVHGDLYSRHIIVDTFGMPSGLIDWGDVHIGHPVMDLSIGRMILADAALEAFYTAYGQISPSTLRLCDFRRLTHSIALLPYCVQRGEEKLKQWTLLALRRDECHECQRGEA